MEPSGSRETQVPQPDTSPNAQDDGAADELRHRDKTRSLAEQARGDAADDGNAASQDETASGGVAAHEPNRPTSEVLGDLSHQITHLVRDEVRLALAESRTKGKRLGLVAGMGGVAAVLGLLGAMALTATVIAAIAMVLATWLSALIVGTALVLAALAALGGVALEVRRARPTMPEETIGCVREDIETVKGHTSS
ncbi:phage holin family protein [Tomitella cavernea]|uniref:Phage holin family protein n=1 Tax=Tomitella cavernea TaxID=1387982 RepID=A0ABP9CLL7_9ACTN|nr:phage holin family protein [Tomitella cavernea]